MRGEEVKAALANPRKDFISKIFRFDDISVLLQEFLVGYGGRQNIFLEVQREFVAHTFSCSFGL
jgi:hypothetical protein